MQKSTNTTKRKAYGYIRVSTDRQAEEGDSLEAQRRAIELVCELEGFELAEVFADPAVSGSIPLAKRPEGSRLIAAMETNSIVVGTRLDRVFRDAHDALGTLKTLQRKRAGLYLRDLGGDVTSSNVSALVFGLLASVSQFERARISDRIRDVRRMQRAQSRFLGGDVPLGFKVQTDPATAKKIIVPDEVLQAEARKLKAQGYSSRLAAGHLTSLGYRTSHKSLLRLWAELDNRTLVSS